MYKRYLDVEVRWTKEGNIIPTAIIWETADGTERFEITKFFPDRVQWPVRQAVSVNDMKSRLEEVNGTCFWKKISGLLRAISE